jgi:hypothetical protein
LSIFSFWNIKLGSKKSLCRPIVRNYRECLLKIWGECNKNKERVVFEM